MERSVLLLYMSPFGKNPNIHTQTNEAAVLKLKKHKEGPDCILALCSELVRTSYRASAGRENLHHRGVFP